MNNIKDLDPVIDALFDLEYRVDKMAGDFHSGNTIPVYPDYLDYFLSDDPEKQAKAQKMRKVGKTLGLSLLYVPSRMSAVYTLVNEGQMSGTEREISLFVNKWYDGVAVFEKNLQNYLKYTRKTGWIITSLGKPFQVPDIKLKYNEQNSGFISKAKKTALNIPIQHLGAQQVILINDQIFKYKNTKKI